MMSDIGDAIIRTMVALTIAGLLVGILIGVAGTWTCSRVSVEWERPQIEWNEQEPSDGR